MCGSEHFTPFHHRKSDTTCQLNNILALQIEVSCVGFEFFTVATVKSMFSECGTLLFGV